jgi:hypothetical protein
MPITRTQVLHQPISHEEALSTDPIVASWIQFAQNAALSTHTYILEDGRGFGTPKEFQSSCGRGRRSFGGDARTRLHDDRGIDGSRKIRKGRRPSFSSGSTVRSCRHCFEGDYYTSANYEDLQGVKDPRGPFGIIAHLLGQAHEGWLASQDNRAGARSGMSPLGSPTRVPQIINSLQSQLLKTLRGGKENCSGLGRATSCRTHIRFP